MARVKLQHRCAACGAVAARWSGRCGGCGAWNTLTEEPVVGAPSGTVGLAPASPPVPIGDVERRGWSPRPTGVDELDRVLGGGLVPGSVTLLGGEPGIGKSTLVLQVLAAAARAGRPALLVSGEESAAQVTARAARLGALVDGLWLQAETALPHVLAAAGDLGPELVVVDSIQTLYDPALGAAPGTVTQVRECAARLVRFAKERGASVVLVGHVTKEGALAGPRVLEHVVDTVLSFEGDRHQALRLLRAVKHRFGPTAELGVFEMSEQGLVGVADPSSLLLGDRRSGASGSAVVATMEGRRPLLVEVQALVVASKQVVPRRSAQGVDLNRLAVLLAVLGRHCRVHLGDTEVYASAVGGVRVTEPAADLGLALALASAASGTPVPPDLVACGEVGLTGEVRQVGHLERRLTEAARLGFARAIVPRSAPAGPAGMELVRVRGLREAVDVLGLAADGRPTGVGYHRVRCSPGAAPP
jgi:DNA repair protein RadA/Sms